MRSPQVAIIMPVRNGEPFLAQTLASLAGQTFHDFEIIAVNDGSTDRTEEMLRSFQGAPIRVISHPRSRGIAVSANEAIALTRAPLLARMDGDDICEPQRLQSQAQFLEKHPEVTLLGMGVACFRSGENPRHIVSRRLPPVSHEEIRYRLCWTNAFNHPTVCFRRSAFDSLGGYNPDSANEDYELWCRWVERFRAANLSEIGIRYRLHSSQYSQETHVKEEVLRVRSAYWQALLQLSLQPELVAAFHGQTEWRPELWRDWDRFVDGLAHWIDQSGSSRPGSLRRDLARRHWSAAQKAGLNALELKAAWRRVRDLAPAYAIGKLPSLIRRSKSGGRLRQKTGESRD